MKQKHSVRPLPVAVLSAVLILLITLLGSSIVPVHAQTAIADFDDLPVGNQYTIGQRFVSGGLPFCVESFTWAGGQETSDGYTEISDRNMAGTRSPELWTNNANLRSGFTGVLTQLFLTYGAHGGNVNLRINNEVRYDFGRPGELNGETIGGVEIIAQEDDQGFGVLMLQGPIRSFAIGGQEFAVDNIEVEGEFFPNASCSNSAYRILLVTQGNRTAEYNVSIQPGVARGHPNQFNQWMVVVLDQQRRPLDAYGIWDPRLTLVHDVEESHSLIEFDPDTAYLFDVVIPFRQDYNDGLPVEMLLFDQDLQLLADVVLTQAIEEYCAENGQQDITCGTINAGDLAVDPVSDLPGASFNAHPLARTDNTDSWLVDSLSVRNCLPTDPMSAEELDAMLAQCGTIFK